MSKFVLDSSAILAFLNREDGSTEVEKRIPDSVVAMVNVAEVMTKSIEAGHTAQTALESFALLNLQVIDFDFAQAVKVGELRPLTKKLGLSLGDRSCLALAMMRGSTAVTADRNWKKLRLCPIELIR